MHYVQSHNPDPYYIQSLLLACPLAVQFTESLMVLLELTMTMTLDFTYGWSRFQSLLERGFAI
jgi:hypothetical protein